MQTDLKSNFTIGHQVLNIFMLLEALLWIFVGEKCISVLQMGYNSEAEVQCHQWQLKFQRKEWNRLTLDMKVQGMAVRISRSLQIKAIIRSAIIRSARPERDLMSLIWYRSTETLTQTIHFQARLLKFQLLTMSNSWHECIHASF